MTTLTAETARRAGRIPALALAFAFGATAPGAPAAPPELRWGGDAEGGLPFIEADPRDPSKLRGFDVEVATAVSARLGRTARFVQVAYQSLDQSVARGDYDLSMSGVEDTPARRAALAVTIPYFEFREVLTVRAGDAARFRTLDDLRGRKLATLGGTMAYEIVLAARAKGIEPVSYDDDVHPYSDLAAGRVDAVLLDHVIAARAERRTAGLVTQPDAVATGRYVYATGKERAALRDDVDGALRDLMRDGTLERIYRTWRIWDDGQRALFDRVLAAGPAPPAPGAAAASGEGAAPAPAGLAAYGPALFRAAAITLVLSCLAMALAVVAGVGIASGRVYGAAPLRALLTLYVEVVRGTPVLLQLFVLYYGLSAVVKLPAFLAALLGLGLNYAAYESEIYRGALEAVPKGQLEAARTLGFTEAQVLRLVRGPQALRLALAPMTNDFVALLKDSSLVSVITVVELTKQTSIFAANVGSWVVPGLLCAALYLAMSLPLSHLAKRLEARWKAPGA